MSARVNEKRVAPWARHAHSIPSPSAFYLSPLSLPPLFLLILRSVFSSFRASSSSPSVRAVTLQLDLRPVPHFSAPSIRDPYATQPKLSNSSSPLSHLSSTVCLFLHAIAPRISCRATHISGITLEAARSRCSAVSSTRFRSTSCYIFPYVLPARRFLSITFRCSLYRHTHNPV
jgi:hypothetical protein